MLVLYFLTGNLIDQFHACGRCLNWYGRVNDRLDPLEKRDITLIWTLTFKSSPVYISEVRFKTIDNVPSNAFRTCIIDGPAFPVER